MNHKVLIQIAIMENGEAAVNSTSKNPATNVWLCEVAKTFFMGSVRGQEESEIIKPRFDV